jgi:hypothetical protein
MFDTYTYHVEDGQFSFEFKAPLLFRRGEKFQIHNYSKELRKVDMSTEIKVVNINFDTKIIDCVGFIDN